MGYSSWGRRESDMTERVSTYGAQTNSVASQAVLVVQNLPADAGGCKRCRVDPWVGKMPLRRAQQPTPGFLPGEPHGQRRLAGYGPQDTTESDMTAV